MWLNIKNYFNKFIISISLTSVRTKDYECPYDRCKNVHMRRKFKIIPQNSKLFSKMSAEPYKSFLKNIYRHLNDIYQYQLAQFSKLSWRPIVRLFDGLTDRMENRRENRAMGAPNRIIGCDFEESYGIGRTLTCQTRSDELHPIIYFYHFYYIMREIHYGISITKIVSDRWDSGNEKSDGI